MAANFAAFDTSKVQPWLARDAAATRLRIDMMERILERAIVIPGLGRGVGLDAVLGFVPVAGDVIAGAMGLYLIWEARNLGMGKATIARMLWNVGVDTTIGAVPVVGDFFDFFFRSNTRNLRLIKRHLDKHHPGTATITAR
ncbi:MAG: DUF4112 domain-containing protein [Sandarakinorhabdus sp.]|nr:DUF4112 domain-containing protein [Sandarakinorhabdus sp.]